MFKVGFIGFNLYLHRVQAAVSSVEVTVTLLGNVPTLQLRATVSTVGIDMLKILIVLTQVHVE